MELRTYFSFPKVIVASLALILWHSDYQWLLTTNNLHFVSPLKRRSFEIKSGKGSSIFNTIVTGPQQLLCPEKQAFSPEFSHTSALKYKVRLA